MPATMTTTNAASAPNTVVPHEKALASRSPIDEPLHQLRRPEERHGLGQRLSAAAGSCGSRVTSCSLIWRAEQVADADQQRRGSPSPAASSARRSPSGVPRLDRAGDARAERRRPAPRRRPAAGCRRAHRAPRRSATMPTKISTRRMKTASVIAVVGLGEAKAVVPRAAWRRTPATALAGRRFPPA